MPLSGSGLVLMVTGVVTAVTGLVAVIGLMLDRNTARIERSEDRADG